MSRNPCPLLVPKLHLGTQLPEKLRFEEHVPGAAEAQLREHIRSQVQLGNEKDTSSYPHLPAGVLMSLGIALAFLLMAAQGAFAAESFDTRLARAHDTLRNGDPDGALTTYRELQTEDPESEVLYYSMGCAQYEQGAKLIEDKAPRDAVESFKTSRESFEKVLNARDPEIRKDAQYNHANAAAQIAINSVSAQQYEESKKAFEDSVKEYEVFLKQYPDHADARQNLDHVRYMLKSMLQNPPPQQPQQQGQQGQDDKDKDQQKDQRKQDKQQQQDPDQKKDEDKKQDEQAGQDKQQEKQQQEQQQAGAEAAKQDEKDQQKESADNPQPESHQNVEAILQSLEDTDKREQKETKNVRTEIKIGKDWW